MRVARSTPQRPALSAAAPAAAGDAAVSCVREAAALERMSEGARWFISIGAVAAVAGAVVHASLSHGAVRVAGLLAIAGGLVGVLCGVRWLRLLADARRALTGPVREVLLVRHLELLSRTEPWNSELLAWDAHERPLVKLGAWQWARPLFLAADRVPARAYGRLTHRSAVVVSCSAGVVAGRVACTFEP
jgi:hypothetical protein